jgi:N-acetylmuramoyl-L-alanine amidase
MALTIVQPSLVFGSLPRLPRERVEYLVVHTQGAPRNTDGSVVGIHEYHRRPVAQSGRGWAGVGYHFVVRHGGTVERGRPIDRQGAHVGGANDRSIGICCSGNGDLADFTREQKRSLAALVEDLRTEFPTASVEGHRPLVDALVSSGRLGRNLATTKTCPGTRVNMRELGDLIGLSNGTPRPGDRRYSPSMRDHLVLTRFVHDGEWYFVPASRPERAEIRAGARWSEMPMGPG